MVFNPCVRCSGCKTVSRPVSIVRLDYTQTMNAKTLITITPEVTVVYGMFSVRVDVPPLVRRHVYVSIDRVVHYLYHTYWQAELYVILTGQWQSLKPQTTFSWVYKVQFVRCLKVQLSYKLDDRY